MKTITVKVSDEVHSYLIKMKKIFRLKDLNEAIELALWRFAKR